MTWKRILRGFGISLIPLFTTEPQGLMVKTTCWKADVCKLHHCCRVALSLTDWVMRMLMPSHSKTITFCTWNFEIFRFFSPLILQTRHSCMIEWTLKDFSFTATPGKDCWLTLITHGHKDITHEGYGFMVLICLGCTSRFEVTVQMPRL